MNNLSVEELKHILNSVALCIFYKDKTCHYIFANHKELLNCSEDTDISGKTADEIYKNDKIMAERDNETDRRIFKTKKGISYTIETHVSDDIHFLEITKEPVLSVDNEVIGIVGTINDITEHVLLQNRTKELATIDQLTRVYNRQYGTALIEKKIADKTTQKVFCVADVNKFKHINDNYGHSVGDTVLKLLGEKLIKATRRGIDIVMRLGGDEFIILIESQEAVDIIITRLKTAVSSIKVDEHPDLKVSISIGCVCINDSDTFDSLYLKADESMYKDKETEHARLEGKV